MICINDIKMMNAIANSKAPLWRVIYENMEDIDATINRGVSHSRLAGSLGVSRSTYYYAKKKAIEYRGNHGDFKGATEDQPQSQVIQMFKPACSRSQRSSQQNHESNIHPEMNTVTKATPSDVCHDKQKSRDGITVQKVEASHSRHGWETKKKPKWSF